MPIAPRQPRRVAGGDLGAESLLFERLGRGLGGVAELVAPLVVLVPDVGHAGLVLAEHVVVAERVAEEVRAFDAALDRLVLVVVHHHRRHARDLRVDGLAHGDTVLGERRLVVVDPVGGLFGVDERERERSDALLGGQEDRLAA